MTSILGVTTSISEVMTSICVITARCYAERGYATISRLSVRPSVCDVQVYSSHRLRWYTRK